METLAYNQVMKAAAQPVTAEIRKDGRTIATVQSGAVEVVDQAAFEALGRKLAGEVGPRFDFEPLTVAAHRPKAA